MKKNDVLIGASYLAKVSGQLVEVRIAEASPHGGWNAINLRTGRAVRIRTAGRLRRAVSDAKRTKAADDMVVVIPAAAEARAAAEDDHDPDVCATLACGRPAALTYLGRPRCPQCYQDEVADGGDETSETINNEETTMATTKKATRKSATRTTKAPKAAKQPKAAKPKAERKPAGDAKPKRVSALDAAAEVLRKAGQPMRAQELITAMAEQGLWSSPNGKTPHATLYAAMTREIAAKGGAARFRKTDRGQFEYTG